MNPNEWHTRPGTQDRNIIQEVYYGNCYHLPPDLSEYAVIDVGAHIGAFFVAAVERKAMCVLSYEADHGNYEVALENRAILLKDAHPTESRKHIVTLGAVVGDANPAQSVVLPRGYHSWQGFEMTGGKSVCASGQETVRPIADPVAETVTLAVKARDVFYSVTSSARILLKLDCEGSEYQILDSDLPFYRIDVIVGESHKLDPGFDPLYPDGRTIADVRGRLESLGYRVKIATYPNDDRLHLFYAVHERAIKS